MFHANTLCAEQFKGARESPPRPPKPQNGDRKKGLQIFKDPIGNGPKRGPKTYNKTQKNKEKKTQIPFVQSSLKGPEVTNTSEFIIQI